MGKQIDDDFNGDDDAMEMGEGTITDRWTKPGDPGEPAEVSYQIPDPLSTVAQDDAKMRSEGRH